ncbi:MAG: pantothenate kinase [Candidatus Aenigmarchaeota archaeon]|nr:pantothenate kinase [Candidatus Aenigmarchaeota archaeon]NIP40545.1 pantothenate kinase [Candidatus Aenigmarchaeota archaeon]NIQ18390.1 pantothenate kinase [Candidatus Aenigmarchaeota archaeon]
MIIGIDIGGSTTQGILLRNGKVSSFCSIQASDELASAAGCLGKIMNTNRIEMGRVKLVAATGGGSKKRMSKKILGIPVRKIDEVRAIGLGGLNLTRKSKCFVVSIGTGTAMVAVKDNGRFIRHVGGTGIGGGTLKGLFRLILNKHDIDNLEALAKRGDLRKVDLTVKDIVGKGIGKLPANATAANFAKLSDHAEKNDIALGLLNMVGEVIGTLSVFAARNYGLERDIVFVGKVTKNRTLMKNIQQAVRTFGGKSIVPKNAEFATAIGAAKALNRK